jgi:hypothetical protein
LQEYEGIPCALTFFKSILEGFCNVTNMSHPEKFSEELFLTEKACSGSKG